MTFATLSINAVFLAEDDTMPALDRKMLRISGVTQRAFFSSGKEALEYLTSKAQVSEPVSLLVCNERLADMTGLQFLAHVRSHPACSAIPLLFLTGNGRSPAAVAAAASQSCAVLARPYSPHAAESAVALAQKPHMQRAPLSLPPSFADGAGKICRTDAGQAETAPRNLPRRPLPGDLVLREGMAALQRNELETAAKFLNGAYAADPLRVETCLALAKLAQLRMEDAHSSLWIARAALLCLRRNNTGKAREILSRLPRDKTGQAALLRAADEALQQGEIRAAALSFIEAQRLYPTQELHALVSRTCMFTATPDEHMQELVKAMASSGHEATAARLHTRLLQKPRLEEAHDEDSFLSRFPVLHTIVTVAAHTFKAWRYAA